MFKGVSQEEICEVFSEYGLVVPDNKFNFSDINIVIGINGAGKTRFLNAINKLHRKCEDQTIYGYFPALSGKMTTTSYYCDGDEPEVSLYEFNDYDDVCFEDFLKEVERQGYEYLERLLSYHSRRERERGEKALSSFNTTFNKLTGYELRTEDKHIYLNKDNEDNVLNEQLQMFSPGQIMLFYISIFISLQSNKKKKIIILDEPECHLHPNALIEFINLVKEIDCLSELWIATHSIFVVPKFEFENIVYIENGTVIKRQSQLYNNMLEKMIGENYADYFQFMSNLQQWQYYNYILECFTDPTTIDIINPHDEQVRMFVQFLEQHDSPVILDYGGGSARLGQSIMISDFERKDAIKYEVYDISIDDIKTEELKSKGIKAYNKLPDKEYDCVVMMNVLHEVEPDQWLQLFNDVFALIKDDGFLVFVEVSELTKGEMPNDIGYLVLGTNEVKLLFNSPKPFFELKLRTDKQKSFGTVVPKCFVNQISNKTVACAISALRDRSYNCLIDERKSLISENNFKKKSGIKTSDKDSISFSGRKYAFYIQQFINAKLFLENNSFISHGGDVINYASDMILINNKLFYRNKLAEILIDSISKLISSQIIEKDDFDICVLVRKRLKTFLSNECDDARLVLDFRIKFIELKENRREEMASLCSLALFIMGYIPSKELLLEYLPKYIKDTINNSKAAGSVVKMPEDNKMLLK